MINIAASMRVAFSRIRLGSHRLKIETGRWSRIPREARLCTCGAIQTEQHVLLICPDSEPLRGQFPRLDFKELGALMNGNCLDLANFCYMVLQKFGNIKGKVRKAMWVVGIRILAQSLQGYIFVILFCTLSSVL